MKAIPTFALLAAGVAFAASTPLGASETDDRIEASFTKAYAYKIYLKHDAINNVMTVVTTRTSTEETETETIDDASITAQVRVALLLHHSTSSVNTEVGTTNGVVTVSGIAKNIAEKTLVTKLAADINGVKSVVNNMTIAPALSGKGVQPGKAENPRLLSQSE